MTDAKNAATKVALEAAGYTVRPVAGLTVSDLVSGTPAERVLKYGDIILTADGRTITGSRDLTAVIEKHRAGEQVTIGILRSGQRQTVKVGIASDATRRFE